MKYSVTSKLVHIILWIYKPKTSEYFWIQIFYHIPLPFFIKHIIMYEHITHILCTIIPQIIFTIFYCTNIKIKKAKLKS